jgi:hypothetical protein
LSYLLIVDDERDGYFGVVWPLEAWETFLAIAFEVAWKRILGMCGVDFRHDDDNWKRIIVSRSKLQK